MQFQISREFIEKIENLVEDNNNKELLVQFENMHHADIAEILEELSLDDATYVIKLLESDKTAEVLMELDEEDREKVLNNLSAKEIAEEIEEMDTDDAADIVGELSPEINDKCLDPSCGSGAFLIGLVAIIFSEATIRFISKTAIQNIGLITFT